MTSWCAGLGLSLGIGAGFWWMGASVRTALHPPAHPPATDEPPPAHEVALLQARDGSRFDAWILRPAVDRPRARLVVLHGYYADRRQVAGLAARLRDRGYEAALMDLRGHGSRPGPFTFGVRETDDVRAVLEWGRAHDGGVPLPAAIIGFSAGAAIACQAVRRCPEVRALVVDSVSPRLRLAIQKDLQLHYPSWLAPMAWLTWWALELALRARLAACDPWTMAPLLRTPILMIAGGADRRVEPSLARAFAARWAGPVDWWFNPDAGHVGSYANDPTAYVSRVAAFLDRVLG